MTEKFFGKAMKRVEDPRFITGTGNYTDDISVLGMVHAAMVRSPYAHAKIKRIDSSAALALPGVLAVITGKELVDAGINPIPTGWLLPDLKISQHHAIQPEEVNHVGNIVAAVIAESRAVAQDAVALVEVEYEALDSVTLGSAALAAGAVQVHPEAPGNLAFDWEIGDRAATEAEFAKADKIIRLELRNHRLVANAIEPRASLAEYRRAGDEYTLYTTSQNPHIHRVMLGAFIMGIPEHKLRIVSPDVGGGFGSKIFQYPEEVIVLFAAKKLNRPVKWTATRSEAFMSDAQGRDHESVAEAAVTNEGKLLALRVDTIANLGAYLTTFAPAVPT
jgi:aerobic carbon-monoxide dehydrogenase large subunit